MCSRLILFMQCRTRNQTRDSINTDIQIDIDIRTTSEFFLNIGSKLLKCNASQCENDCYKKSRQKHHLKSKQTELMNDKNECNEHSHRCLFQVS